MKFGTRRFSAVLVGAGPAGLAVLLSAHRDGTLTELLRRGLLIVERSSTIGAGQIGDYAINSDSSGETFLDSLRSAREPALFSILQTPVAQRILSAGQGSVALQDVGELMLLIGEAFRSILAGYPQCAILTGSTAEYARAASNGDWYIHIKDASGKPRRFATPNLILATGAAQPAARLRHEFVAGVSVAERWGQKLIQSGEVIARGGLQRVAERLQGRGNPKVVILGGSTSAAATAHALLHRLPDVQFQPGGVTLMHRRPLRLYYTSADAAVADGYRDFSPADVCPVTSRLYRFAGLRLESRELIMQVSGVGGRPEEPRLAMHSLCEDDAEAIRKIDQADLVIAAFGYRPNGLRLLDRDGRSISLLAESGPAAPLVDGACRVLDTQSRVISGVFGIGLAAGFRPRGRFGGEPSFQGQVNGLWVWQNGVGSIIANAVLQAEAKRQVRERRRVRVAGRESLRGLFPLRETA